MRERHVSAYLVPAVIALVGPLVLIAATDGGFLPFALGWWLLSLVVALIRPRKGRVAAAAALVPLCVLTTFEGGLWMLPAVVALLVVELSRPSGGAMPRTAEPSAR